MNSFSQLLLLPLLAALLLAGCRKSNVDPIDQLPPATQEGKFTFGCLVNGKAYLPKGAGLGGPVLSAYYQHLNTSTAQGYFFNVAAKRDNKNSKEGIAINGNGLALKEGEKYVLRNSPDEGEIFAEYVIFLDGHMNAFETRGPFQGELHITRFDQDRQIVAGTFWFDAVNDRGEKVEVRQGRFDMLYSQ
jgi:hypothetical protein